MRSLAACLVLIASSSLAHADELSATAGPGVAEAGPAPVPIDRHSASPSGDAARSGKAGPFEFGIYSGGFISNYFHQFYDYSLFPGQVGDPVNPVREELKRVSPLVGLRFAYFFKSWLGAEAEVNMIMTSTKYTDQPAKIYGGRVQLMFQAANVSPYVVPYVAIGDGFDRVSSDDTVLGSDTDWAPHIGAGARFFVHPSFAIRVDGRFLRAPSQQAPYHLNASLGEFMVGISYRPARKSAEIAAPPIPDVDTDGDGLLDAVDRCPNEAEDKDLFDDTDGCPDLDNDADGIPDATDQCQLEAEDKDGFQDEDGCLDKDNDGDGVLDVQDKCPSEPEDRDNHKDMDGCPDLDNDSDGFSDAMDRCPNEAEVINGTDDDDGCPDRGNALVVVSPDRLELLESITFKKTIIQKDSTNLLSQVGATLRANPQIKRLRVTVHVQPTKNPEADQRLSETRAFAIREWLIKYGIDEKRLDPRGFGGTKPLVDPKTKNAAGINDRVDLIILERD